MASEKTKRIARNTALMYARMGIVMLVSLFTARVVIETLGVNDYGVYNVVGGVMVMFTFISTSLSSAVSRFITYALGKGDIKNLETTFSTCVIAMCCIGLVLVLIGETVGLWFLENKLVIPEDSRHAARVVYQLSIAGTFLGLCQQPYGASIMAHEKMGIYAYFEILNISLKLLVLYLLVMVDENKLILYAWLTFGVSVIMMTLYRIYCITKLPGCRFNFRLDKPLLRKMLVFSGWDLFGNCSTMVRTTGISMLVNMFFGVVANAAIGIATAVQGAVGALTGNLVTATRPQIIKSYAAGDYDYMVMLIMSLSRVVFLTLLIFSIPFMIEMPFILKIWLKDVPQYAAGLSCLTVAFLFFSSLSYIVCTGVHAIGDLRRCNFINGTLYISVLPITWVAFKWFGGSVYLPYALNASFVLVGCLVNVYTVHLYVKQMKMGEYIVQVLVRCLAVGAVGAIAAGAVAYFIDNEWLRFFAVFAAALVVMLPLGYIVGLDDTERRFISRTVAGAVSKVCPRHKQA